jgi:transposase InsO family protein
MKEQEVEIILQRAVEKFPDAKPRIISDNGPQFIAKDFKEFIRICGMTHVRTSPFYPQSNGKIVQLPGVRGTLWAAYNAITRFEDYKQPQQNELPDQRLERTWFGGGADIKLKALEKATQLSVDWS